MWLQVQLDRELCPSSSRMLFLLFCDFFFGASLEKLGHPAQWRCDLQITCEDLRQHIPALDKTVEEMKFNIFCHIADAA